jgi:hypothetical protein
MYWPWTLYDLGRLIDPRLWFMAYQIVPLLSVKSLRLLAQLSHVDPCLTVQAAEDPQF